MSKTNNLNGYSFEERIEIRKFYSRLNIDAEKKEHGKTLSQILDEMAVRLRNSLQPVISIPMARNSFDWKFSPLEYQCWSEIKCTRHCRSFVPEYPIDKYFVDFADPVHRVVIECDGRKYHKDKNKDQIRQQFIESLGWTVFRFDAAQIFSNVYENLIVQRMGEMAYESIEECQEDIERFKNECIGCFLRSNEFMNLLKE